MRKFLSTKWIVIALLMVATVTVCRAQASLAGDWEGVLNANGTDIHITWHVKAAADGTVTSTFDNREEGATGIKAKITEFKDSKITVTVDDQVDMNGSMVNIRGNLVGTVSPDGNELTGTWTQTDPEAPPMELHLKKTPGVGAAPPAPQGGNAVQAR